MHDKQAFHAGTVYGRSAIILVYLNNDYRALVVNTEKNYLQM